MRGVKVKIPEKQRSRHTPRRGGAWFPWYIEIPLILLTGRLVILWYSWK